MKLLIVLAALLAVASAGKKKKEAAAKQQQLQQEQKVQDFCANLCNSIEDSDDIQKMQKICWNCTQLYGVSDDSRTNDSLANFFQQQ
jgi:hypothetical protein